MAISSFNSDCCSSRRETALVDPFRTHPITRCINRTHTIFCHHTIQRHIPPWIYECHIYVYCVCYRIQQCEPFQKSHASSIGKFDYFKSRHQCMPHEERILFYLRFGYGTQSFILHTHTHADEFEHPCPWRLLLFFILTNREFMFLFFSLAPKTLSRIHHTHLEMFCWQE